MLVVSVLGVADEDDIDMWNAGRRLLRNLHTAIRCCVKIYEEIKGNEKQLNLSLLQTVVQNYTYCIVFLPYNLMCC